MAYNQLEIDGRVYDFNAYPVGSIYISTNSTSPASIFGGTWERLTDRFLIGCGDSYSAGSTGGSKTVTLNGSQIPFHNHYVVSNLEYTQLYRGTTPSGTDNTVTFEAKVNANNSSKPANDIGRLIAQDISNPESSMYTPRGQAHDNMPPYLAVFMWKRTA